MKQKGDNPIADLTTDYLKSLVDDIREMLAFARATGKDIPDDLAVLISDLLAGHEAPQELPVVENPTEGEETIVKPMAEADPDEKEWEILFGGENGVDIIATNEQATDAPDVTDDLMPASPAKPKSTEDGAS